MVENMSGYEIHRARISCAFLYPCPVNTGSVMLHRHRRDVVDWALPLPLNGREGLVVGDRVGVPRVRELNLLEEAGFEPSVPPRGRRRGVRYSALAPAYF